jgi:hypothetical protein
MRQNADGPGGGITSEASALGPENRAESINHFPWVGDRQIPKANVGKWGLAQTAAPLMACQFQLGRRTIGFPSVRHKSASHEAKS